MSAQLTQPVPALTAPMMAHLTRKRAGDMKGISRTDKRGNHGYVVNFRLPGGGRFTKYVADRTHGGRDGALAAALALREEVARAHDIPLRGYRTSGRSPKSNTGVPGVTRVLKRGLAFYYVCWQPAQGANRLAVFPVPRGKDEAPVRERAVRFRQAREQAPLLDLDGGRSLHARLRSIAPDWIRPETRDELVQEMALAVLDGRLTEEELGPHAYREYLRNVYRQNCNPRVRSIEDFIGDDWRLGDTLEG
jgi:hypothetical protein